MLQDIEPHGHSSISSRHRWAPALLLAILAAPPSLAAELPVAVAPESAPVMSPAALEETLRLYIDTQTAGLPGRVEIQIDSVAGRPPLAPCASVEPFIPPGSRLWGRATLSMRCREGARWTVLMPVQVRIYGPGLRSARLLLAGRPLDAGDFEVVDMELTREAPGILTSLDEVSDQVLARALPAGSSLRREHFRPRPVASAGDQVKLVYVGAGFSVASSGKVLHAVAEGQTARVQVESGRVLSGIAKAGRTVEVRF